VNKEDKGLLQAVNQELEQRGRPERFRYHPNYPLYRALVLQVDSIRTLTLWPRKRRLDIFVSDNPDSVWGQRTEIGEHLGHGWIKNLGDSITNVLEAPDGTG